MPMKFDLMKIAGVAAMVAGLVKQTQAKMAGKPGTEKAEVVLTQIGELIPIIEGVTMRDIADKDLYDLLAREVIATEKAALVAKARFAQFIADVKTKKTAADGAL